MLKTEQLKKKLQSYLICHQEATHSPLQNSLNTKTRGKTKEEKIRLEMPEWFGNPLPKMGVGGEEANDACPVQQDIIPLHHPRTTQSRRKHRCTLI